MSNKKEELAPKYVRQRDSDRIFYASEQIMARGDFLPCDAKGNFLASGEMKLPSAKPSPEGPAQDKERIRLEKLREEARALKVRGWNNAKEATLVKGIAAAKAEEAREAASQAAEAEKAEEVDAEADEEKED